MLNSINNFCEDYYNEIPKDSIKVIGRSALYSFTIATIINGRNPTNNLARPALAALIGTTATTINVLATPIFNRLFNNKNAPYNGFESMVCGIFNIGLTHILINCATPYKVSLISFPICLNNNSLNINKFILINKYAIKMIMDIYLRMTVILPSLYQQQFNLFSKFGFNFNRYTDFYISF